MLGPEPDLLPPAPEAHNEFDSNQDPEASAALLPHGTLLNDRLRQRAAKVISAAFDIFAFFLSISDVISDIYVAYQFHVSGRTVFFALAVTVLCISQLAYTGLFVYRYVHWKSYWIKFGCGLAVLPLAQLVPVFVFFESLGCFGRTFRSTAPAPLEDPEEDELRSTIRAKMDSHAGYLLEAACESIPQSIIQMIAMVSARETPWYNVLSVCISLTTIASKGFMLSYCLDRLTFAFNMIAIAYDIFSLFLCVAWVSLFSSPALDRHHIFFLPASVRVDTLSAIFIYKLALLAVLALLSGMFYALHDIVCFIRNWRVRLNAIRDEGGIGRAVVELLTVSVGCIIMAGPALILTEAFKVSALPLSFFTHYRRLHAPQAAAHREWFAWLRAVPSELDAKVFVSNQMYAASFVMSATRNAVAWQTVHPVSIGTYLRQRRCRVAQYYLSSTIATSSAARLREARGYTPASLILRAQLAMKIGEGAGHRLEAVLMQLSLGLWMYVVIPVFAVGSVYTLIYPFLSLALTPAAEVPTFHLVYTVTVAVLLVLVLALAVPTYRFALLVNALESNTFITTMNATGLRILMDEYQHAVQVEAARRNGTVYTAGVAGSPITRAITMLQRAYGAARWEEAVQAGQRRAAVVALMGEAEADRVMREDAADAAGGGGGGGGGGDALEFEGDDVDGDFEAEPHQ